MSWDASLYETGHGFVWKLGAGLLERLAPRHGERILDVGCGTGHLTAQIAGAGAEVVGIDSSEAMVTQARANFPDVCFEVADVKDYRAGVAFDAVFSNAVLHWVLDPEAAVAAMAGALRPGGRLVVEFGGKGNVALVLAAVRELAGIENPWYFPSVGEYASIVEGHGLEVAEAALFDRPTCTEGREGLRNWIRMFGRDWPHEEDFLAAMERKLRPSLYRDNSWWIDYRRIRVVAMRR